MKYVIFTILMLVIQAKSNASEIKFEVMQGFATHYMKYKGYNDSVFKDDLTSTVTLARISYEGFGLTGLADSQGDLSFALTKEFIHYKTNKMEVKSLIGTYILRNDVDSNIFSQEINSMLLKINVGERRWSVLPLAGIQADFNLVGNVNATILVTPTFTLWGLNLKF